MDLQPHLHEGIYVFCKVSSLESITLDDCIGTFRESEGITVIISKEKADQLGLEYTYEAAWISLLADTALDMVGLTAKFSTALAKERISCNVIAAYHHDHIFVAAADAEKAIRTLERVGGGH